MNGIKSFEPAWVEETQGPRTKPWVTPTLNVGRGGRGRSCEGE